MSVKFKPGDIVFPAFDCGVHYDKYDQQHTYRRDVVRKGDLLIVLESSRIYREHNGSFSKTGQELFGPHFLKVYSHRYGVVLLLSLWASDDYWKWDLT